MQHKNSDEFRKITISEIRNLAMQNDKTIIRWLERWQKRIEELEEQILLDSISTEELEGIEKRREYY